MDESIHDLTELVRPHLQDSRGIYGVTLNEVKVADAVAGRADV